jgi:hypothetical protein
MYKILFAKFMLGEETELLEFVRTRFDVLVLSITGTQLNSAKKSIEHVHALSSNIYFRSQFVHTIETSELVTRAEYMLNCGADGFIFHGNTTDKSSDELIMRFSEIAAAFSEKQIVKPIVFMVDQFAGDVNLLSKVQKLIDRDDFQKNIDVRVAVRISTKTIKEGVPFPATDLQVIDFWPLDGKEVYKKVMSAVNANKLNAVAYMTFDNMSDDLRKAILEYGRPDPVSSAIIAPVNITVMHDLTLRDVPSGIILRNIDGSPVSIAANTVLNVLNTGNHGNNKWYMVEFSGIIGWIAGRIGSLDYSK